MNSRSTTSVVTFSFPFRLSGYEDELPPGSYEVVIDEELLGGHCQINLLMPATLGVPFISLGIRSMLLGSKPRGAPQDQSTNRTSNLSA